MLLTLLPDSNKFKSTPLGNADLYLNGQLITDLTIPDGVSSISSNAFIYCKSITSATLPNGIESIGDRVFESCENLTSITIPSSMKAIGTDAFLGCSKLTAVYTSDIAKWCEINFNNIYSNPTTHAHNLYLNGQLITNLVIPDGVTSIGNNAFNYLNGSLVSLTIPSSVTKIGDGAFRYCSSLETIHSMNSIPPAISSNNAFEGTYGTPLYVPVGSKEAYQSAQWWKNFYSISEMDFNTNEIIQDYYLIGGFNNWTLKDENCNFKYAGNGVYALDYDGTLTSGFKINDGTWGDVDFGGSETLTLGKTYQLTPKGSNIPTDSNIENPHIEFNPTAQTLLITGQSVKPSVKYGIHGQIFGGAEWTTVDMAPNDNGTWTLLSDIYPGEFGIKAMDAATSNQTDWYSCADSDNSISNNKLGTPLNVKSEGANWSNSITGKVTFIFNPEAMTLTVNLGSSGIDTIIGSDNADENCPVEWFNLQGSPVDGDNLAPGIYLRRQGATVTKVLVN